MFSAVFLAVILTGQAEIKPFPPSPEMAKRIQIAAGQARQWAFTQMPAVSIRRPGQITSDQKRYVLTQAAYKQIREAYNVDGRTFYAILHNKSIRAVPFTQEYLPNGTPSGQIGFATRPWHFQRTRFDETKVVLPEKIARQIGYKNPTPVEVQPHVMRGSGRYAEQMNRMRLK